MSHYDKIIINEREYDFFIGIFSFFILTVYLRGEHDFPMRIKEVRIFVFGK